MGSDGGDVKVEETYYNELPGDARAEKAVKGTVGKLLTYRRTDGVQAACV